MMAEVVRARERVQDWEDGARRKCGGYSGCHSFTRVDGNFEDSVQPRDGDIFCFLVMLLRTKEG